MFICMLSFTLLVFVYVLRFLVLLVVMWIGDCAVICPFDCWLLFGLLFCAYWLVFSL